MYRIKVAILVRKRKQASMQPNNKCIGILKAPSDKHRDDESAGSKNRRHEQVRTESLWRINDALHQDLSLKKCEITEHTNAYPLPEEGSGECGGEASHAYMYAPCSVHGRLHVWDVCKRWTNPYELVTSCQHVKHATNDGKGITSLAPISRAFFKLWEIICDHREALVCGERAMRVMFLAEGPGGFVQAFSEYRRKHCPGVCGADQLHGITLCTPNKMVPHWKAEECRKRQLVMHFGEDSTGDLYNMKNIDSLVQDVGEGTCDLVTADGGFDFSKDFNGQEACSSRLIACETYAAMRLLRPGGSLVLKLYDISSHASVRLLNLLCCAFGDVTLTKPFTSRPANSEKYAVCCNFEDPSAAVLLRAELNYLHTCIKTLEKRHSLCFSRTHPQSQASSVRHLSGRYSFADCTTRVTHLPNMPNMPNMPNARETPEEQGEQEEEKSSSSDKTDLTPQYGWEKVTSRLLEKVVRFNARYIARQTDNICRTLEFIDKQQRKGEKADDYAKACQMQLDDAISWCKQYGICPDDKYLDRLSHTMLQHIRGG